MTINQTELFAELTPEQSATVEGGAALVIHQITAVKAASDGFFGGSTDDVYLTVNGKRLNFKKSMKTGDSATVNEVTDFSRSATLQVFDEDFGSDDRLTRVNFEDRGANHVFRRTSKLPGGSSIYQFEYSMLVQRQ